MLLVCGSNYFFSLVEIQMEEAVWLKFKQHSDLGTMLLATEDAELAEVCIKSSKGGMLIKSLNVRIHPPTTFGE